jgi:hypothetical protein
MARRVNLTLGKFLCGQLNETAESVAWRRANGYRSGMKKQNFWEVDLVELFKLWISDISTFLMTFLMFLALSLPVVIPGLILWYLWSIDWHP